MSEKKDYVDRDEVVSNLEQLMEYYEDSDDIRIISKAIAMVNDATAADVEPVVRGEWKDGIDFDEQNVYMCSVCKEPYILESGTPKENKYNFCPNCGAHMERSGSGSGE